MGLKYNKRCSPVVFYKCFNSNIHNPNHGMIDMLAADINYIFMCLFSVPESYPRSEHVSPEQLRVPEEKQRNNLQISKHPLSKLNCLSHCNEFKTIRSNQRSDDGSKDCLHTSLVFSLSNC